MEFTMHYLPRMANGSGRSNHWRAIANETLTVKAWVHRSVRAQQGTKRKPEPAARAKLTLTRYSSTSPDADGLVSGFKHVIDGLVEAGILVNDRWENIGMPCYRWEKVPAKAGRVHVLVETADECPG